ncbi:ACR053Wp [Eremothecium gossypii ATCC 10895]|uniref:ACR053Wp n=1 Tax=Eremothecium gossypii (strain ATCC 10895 / CBS 109.51 / FGSC 9923 / NRRL Y-1056) TaxID=284811 RepID=Q75C63_EREGS|nr:ACR053Wp [Eremothecium gossypii ATCC 10895]AAS51280.1 ACR053Wp [Eremothecium gossypii ATCC 10895]AEY95571.1 FACR053Wp [Eremothecium gossypii FDAG1]
MTQETLRIAVQGCAHGQLDRIYDAVANMPEQPDLLLVLGDFQSLRTTADYPSISVPRKYASLGDFPSYFSGERTAPVLTVFIGGNHENFAQLLDLPHGGWVARNIYYMGYSNVFWFRGVRIGGLSGIYKHWDLVAARPPTAAAAAASWGSVVRSLYHVRMADALPLLLLDPARRLDVMMSHDWPRGIEQYGNCAQLLRWKPHFRSDVSAGRLGSPLSWEMLRRLRPRRWLSAHLHVKFEAAVDHDKLDQKDSDEIALDLDDAPAPPPVKTEFLALDKCKAGRNTHLAMLCVTADPGHPSAADPEHLFWDPEFISNVRFVQCDPQGLAATRRHFSPTDVQHLFAERAPLRQEPDTDWSGYRIPPFEPEMLTETKIQTEHFRAAFLGPPSVT